MAGRFPRGSESEPIGPGGAGLDVFAVEPFPGGRPLPATVCRPSRRWNRAVGEARGPAREGCPRRPPFSGLLDVCQSGPRSGDAKLYINVCVRARQPILRKGRVGCSGIDRQGQASILGSRGGPGRRVRFRGVMRGSPWQLPAIGGEQMPAHGGDDWSRWPRTPAGLGVRCRGRIGTDTERVPHMGRRVWRWS